MQSIAGKTAGLVGLGAISLAWVSAVIVGSELSATWWVMLLIGLGVGALLLWSGDPKRWLLFAFVFTFPVEISKGLVAEHGVYAPGLYLSLSDLPLAGFLALWAFDKLVARREPIYRDRTVRYALFFTAWAWASTLYSTDVLAGIFAALSLTKYFLTFVAVADYVREVRLLRRVLAVLALGLSVQLAVALLQFAAGGAFQIQGAKLAVEQAHVTLSGGAAFRPHGLLSHPNPFAGYLVFFIPALLGFVLLGPARIGSLRYASSLLLLGCCVVCLVLTLSRGGWIAGGIAVASFVVLGLRAGVVTARQGAWVAGSFLAAAVATAAFYPAAVLRLESDRGSGHTRVVLMEQSLRVIGSAPVLGVGLGGYLLAGRRNLPPSYATLNDDFQKALHESVVHNKFLLTAAEQGLVGLVLYAVLLWKFFGLYFRGRWLDPVRRSLAIGIVSSFAGQMALYLFDPWFIGTAIHQFWLFASLLLVLGRQASLLVPAAAVRPEDPGAVGVATCVSATAT